MISFGLTVRQMDHLTTTHRVDVPPTLTTLFSTHLRVVKKYANQRLCITTFYQSRYPRIFKDTIFLFCSKGAIDGKRHRCPPVHGDLYNIL